MTRVGESQASGDEPRRRSERRENGTTDEEQNVMSLNSDSLCVLCASAVRPVFSSRAPSDLKLIASDSIIRAVLFRYLRNLNAGRLILWCYFIWYLVVLVRYFDPDRRIWATSFGLCALIGFALYVNTAFSGPARLRIGFWPTVRLFMMPFCVS